MQAADKFILVKASTPQLQEQADSVLTDVFTGEQKISEEKVLEKHDHSVFYIYKDSESGKVAGALRYSVFEPGYKIERVAVRKEFRGLGIGKKMILALVEEIKPLLKEGGIIYSYVQSQTCEFYKRCGFEIDPEKMVIVGIDHYRATLPPLFTTC